MKLEDVTTALGAEANDLDGLAAKLENEEPEDGFLLDAVGTAPWKLRRLALSLRIEANRIATKHAKLEEKGAE